MKLSKIDDGGLTERLVELARNHKMTAEEVKAQKLSFIVSGTDLTREEILKTCPELAPMPPKGYVLVPIEPTLEMIEAARNALSAERARLTGDDRFLRHRFHRGNPTVQFNPIEKHAIRWKAMLKAAPKR